MLEWLNANSGAFSVLFAAVVAIATAVYAILTWVLVRETRVMRRSQTEPLVSVHARFNDQVPHILELVIENIGLGPAREITFSIENDFDCLGHSKLSELAFIREGLHYLAPHHSRTLLLAAMAGKHDETPARFTVHVNYMNAYGEASTSTYVIDLRDFKDWSYLEPTSSKVARSLEHIARDMGHLSSGFHRLRADVKLEQDT